MAEWVRQVIDENSTYYVLAWRPLNEEQKRRGFKDVQGRISKDGPN